MSGTSYHEIWRIVIASFKEPQLFSLQSEPYACFPTERGVRNLL
jgi:hypothetical protein